MSTVETIEDRVSFRNRPLIVSDARGAQRSILLSGVPVFDAGTGRFAGYRGTGLDIAEHGLLRDEADGLPAGFEDLAELVSAWRWEADAGLRITQLSEGYADHAGLAREHSQGRVFTDLWQLDNASRSAVQERKLFRDQHSVWIHARLGEERDFVIAGKPVFDASGRFLGYRGLGADITPPMRAAAAPAARSGDGTDSASNEFLANVSHELRTPLNAIIGFSDAMRGEALGPLRNKKYLQYAEDIHSSARFLLDIVSEILDFSRLEAGKMPMDEKAVVLADLVEGCCRLLRDEAEKAGLDVQVDLAPELPDLRADPVKLKQILLNLMSNAIKFTPEGGTVAVRVEVNESDNLEIEVRDTGVGIKDSDLPRVLSRFGQGSPADSALGGNSRGTGLGLPIAKGLVEMHGGTLEILSGDDSGTRAIVEIPGERLLGEDSEAKPWKVLF